MPKMTADIDALMRLLSGHLYRRAGVFLRELVQNAHDSVLARQEAEPGFVGRVCVEIDTVGRTLTVRDDGIGMSRRDVVEYLSAIGSSGTRTRRDAGVSEGAIGQFGIGFLSALSVARRIHVWTRRLGTDEALCWSSCGGAEYELEVETTRPCNVGTAVQIELAREHEEFLEASYVHELVSEFAVLLPVPIDVDGQAVERTVPPWRGGSLKWIDDRDAVLAFAGRHLGHAPRWAFGVHDDDAGVFGVLAIDDPQPGSTRTDPSVDLFHRSMLVEHGREAPLPSWAPFLRGAIEASRLAITASREGIRRDNAWRRAEQAIDRATRGALLEWMEHDPQGVEQLLVAYRRAELPSVVTSDPQLLDTLGVAIAFDTTHGPRSVRREVAERGRPLVLRALVPGTPMRELMKTLAAQPEPIFLPRTQAERVGLATICEREAGVSLRMLDVLDDALVVASLGPVELERVPGRRALAERLARQLPDVAVHWAHFEPRTCCGVLTGRSRAPLDRERLGPWSELADALDEIDAPPRALVVQADHPVVHALSRRIAEGDLPSELEIGTIRSLAELPALTLGDELVARLHRQLAALAGVEDP